MRTKGLIVTCVIGFVALGLAPGAAADKGEKQVRFGVVYSSPTDDLVASGQTTELDGALGFAGSFEFRVTDRLGVEPGVALLGYDVTVEETGFPDETGDTDMIALTVDLNFHFKRDSGLDCYVGPTIGYALWDDIELSGFPMPIEADDEFLFGATGGVNVPFGDNGWHFYAGVTYLSLDLPAAGGDIGVSPFNIDLGLGWSF